MSSSGPTLVVIGSINMDLVVYCPRLPKIGETLLGTSFQTFFGGKGANQAVAASRMGASVRMVGRVGRDSFGAPLVENLRTNRVITTWVGQADASSGTALITVDEHGRNTIVVVPGSNHALLPADIQSARPALSGASLVLLQLEIPLETVLESARLAHGMGVRVLLNTAPAQPLPAELYPLVDVLVLNETEAALLTESEIASPRQQEHACRQLLSAGARMVVMTLGGQGALACTENQTLRVPAYPVTPVDTTAAGDSFTAGLAVALAEGRNLPDAMRFACAAGALAVTVRGAQPSIPNRDQVNTFLLNSSTN